MVSRSHWFAVLAVPLLAASAALAQEAVVPAGLPASRPVPSTVRFAGTLPAGGGAILVTFALYEEAVGGEPLWEETQEVSADASGRYAVLLGASRPGGLLAAFADGAPRWLGVRPAEGPEQPRVCLVSVPYALRAADADTIAGRPISSFVLAGDRTGVGPDGLTYVDTRVLSAGLVTGGTGVAGPPRRWSAPARQARPPLVGSGVAGGAGTANYIGMFTDTTNLGNSVIYQTPSGSVGVNTLAPNSAFHVAAAAAPAMYVDVFNNSLGALPVVYRAARGTPAAPSAVQTNDILGGLAVRGYGATTFSAGRGQVMFKAAENWTDEANGTYLQFTTTPIGSGAWAERMRIDPAGNVGIGTATPRQKLSVAGTVESTGRRVQVPGWDDAGDGERRIHRRCGPHLDQRRVLRQLRRDRRRGLRLSERPQPRCDLHQRRGRHRHGDAHAGFSALLHRVHRGDESVRTAPQRLRGSHGGEPERSEQQLHRDHVLRRGLRRRRGLQHGHRDVHRSREPGSITSPVRSMLTVCGQRRH